MSGIQLLTEDTLRPEQLGAYLNQDWRDTPGLIGAWSVAFGPVTRVLFLQRLGKDGEPPPMPASGREVQPELRERRWLREVNACRPHEPEMRFLELRTYDARPRHGAEFLKLMLEALPIREKHSRNCGIWESLSGRQEQVLHLWGYRSLEERDQVRAGLKEDAGWQKYVATILPMLQTLQSIILSPVSRS